MKRNAISSYIIALIPLISFLLLPASAIAQEQKKPQALTDEELKELPLYQGTTVGLDIFGLGGTVLGGSTTSTEIAVEVNLKNRFIPVVEIGYSSTEETNEDTDIYYKSAAPYFRVGMNYNFFFRKPYLPGYLYGGLRLAHSSFSYDVRAPDMTGTTWAYPVIPYAYEGVKSNATWLELLVGIKVKVYKSFLMGWSVRYRSRLSVKSAENSDPWYIPGYGKNKSTGLGITYSLIYQLPF